MDRQSVNKPRFRAFVLAGAASLAITATAAPAIANEASGAPAAEDGSASDRIVVTGSRDRQNDLDRNSRDPPMADA